MRKIKFFFSLLIAVVLVLAVPFAARADISAGLVGYWRFEEGSGDIAHDSGSTGLIGTLDNHPVWSAGAIGGGVVFNASDSRVSIPTAGLSTYSYSVWAYVAGIGDNDQYLLSQDVGGSNACHALVARVQGGVSTLSFGGQTGGSGSAVFTKATWHHIVAVNDGAGNISGLYIDGVRVAQSTAVSCSQTSNNRVVVGAHPSSGVGRDFRGGVDELRVYNRALSQQEVNELFSLRGTPSDTTPPVIFSDTPSSILPSSTKSVTLAIATSEKAGCRYSTTPGIPFDSMPNALGTVDRSYHSSTISVNAGTTQFAVRCRDLVGNTDAQDFFIPVRVAKSCSNASATEYFVSPSGLSTNCGSIDDPWELQHALGGSEAKVRPGVTVWMRGGTYASPVRVDLHGNLGAPITLRNYRRERATFDGMGLPNAFNLMNSSFFRLWGIEFVDSLKASVTQDPYATLDGAGNVGISYINLVSHDNGMGVGNGYEAYGNILYNNGHTAREHGVYWQNDYKSSGLKKYIRDNIIFNSAGFGVHSYSSSGPLNGLVIDGNVLWQNGALLNDSKDNILLGGGKAVSDSEVTNNLVYSSTRALRLGWSFSPNTDVTVTRNYFATFDTPVTIARLFNRLIFTQNTIVSGTNPAFLTLNNLPGQYTIDRNSYFARGAGGQFVTAGASRDFAAWQHDLGFDTNAVAPQAGVPPKNYIVVKPNLYDSEITTVVVFNWQNLNSVDVDLSTRLAAGDHYEIRKAENYYAPLVPDARYNGGTVSFVMNNTSMPTPIGGFATPASSFPAFGVFIVTRIQSTPDLAAPAAPGGLHVSPAD